MKAISLWQPWASLMADGRKKIETRHWHPPAWLLGQELAIHATMKVDRDACEDFGYDALTIPRGCVVAIVRLITYEKFGQDAWKKYPYPSSKEDGVDSTRSTSRWGSWGKALLHDGETLNLPSALAR